MASSGTVVLETTMKLGLEDLRGLPSLLNSLPASSRTSLEQELKSQQPALEALWNSLYWMRHSTNTRDPQNPQRPYRPFPKTKIYHDELHRLFEQEPVFLVEKSRTMMTSWWAVAECTHYVQTRPPAEALFVSVDEDRALQCMLYARTLYTQQSEWLRTLYPLKRPLDQQNIDKIEWASGAKIEVLPGKNPDKIRGYHPAIIFFDEAAFIDRFAEAYAAALFTKAQKILAVTTAHPGDFREMTRNWKEEVIQ